MLVISNHLTLCVLVRISLIWCV